MFIPYNVVQHVEKRAYMKNIIFLLFGISFLSSCYEKKTINVIDVEKSIEKPAEISSTTSEDKKIDYSFKALDSWEKTTGNSMRIGSFTIYDKEKKLSADLSVVVLGMNGGGIDSNINRWLEQLNLKPQTSAQINSKIKKITTKIGVFDVIFIKNKKLQSGIFGAILEGKEKTLFVKATGDLGVLIDQETDLIKFLGSFKNAN